MQLLRTLLSASWALQDHRALLGRSPPSCGQSSRQESPGEGSLVMGGSTSVASFRDRGRVLLAGYVPKTAASVFSPSAACSGSGFRPPVMTLPALEALGSSLPHWGPPTSLCFVFSPLFAGSPFLHSG